MKLLVKAFLWILCITSLFDRPAYAISMLAKNDPYPIYSAIFDPWMVVWYKQYLQGCYGCCHWDEIFSLAVSPFQQKASSGRTYGKLKSYPATVSGEWNMLGMLYGQIPNGGSGVTLYQKNTADTGFIIEPMLTCNASNCSNPIAVQDGCIAGECAVPGSFLQLGNAKVRIFSDLMTSTNLPPEGPINPNIEISEFVNSNYLLTDTRVAATDTDSRVTGTKIGYFNVPSKYRKVGVRFELGIHPGCDWGILVQGGVSEIQHTVTAYIDLGASGYNELPNNTFETINESQPQPDDNNFFRHIPVLMNNEVEYYSCDCHDTFYSCSCTTPYLEIENQLMQQNKARLIFSQIGLDPCDFEKTSIEDFRFILWWRHVYEVNKYCDHCEWPYFFVIPFIDFNVIAPVGKVQDRDELFALPFGNDGHWSVGVDGGISIDFVETVEIGSWAGVNYFLKRDVENYRIPTSKFQSGVFPFATDVTVRPGLNFNYNLYVNAYQFLDKLSAHVEYIFVKHEEDKIELCKPDPAFTPALIEQAECITKFVSQFINAALYYDISPNLALGAMAQFPIAERNAFKSTTWMATIRGVF